MRRYLSKIVTVALVIGFFVISMHIDAPSDMRQYATSVLIDEKYDDADPCSSGCPGHEQKVGQARETHACRREHRSG